MTTTAPTTTDKKSADKKKQPTVPKALPTKVVAQFVIDKAKLAGLLVVFRAASPDSKSTTGKVLQAIWRPREDPAASGSNAAPTPMITIPPTTWVVGQCDASGYLGAPTAGGANPADTYKLTRKGKYEVVLVNHPSLQLAQSIARSLNEDFFGPSVPIKVLEVSDEGKVEVPLDPAAFTPEGPSQYGGFCLFESMPLRDVQSVRDNVVKLQDDLGKLRYIVSGIASSPSAYSHCTTTLAQKTGEQAREQAAEPLMGDFSKQTMNGVYAFQDSARSGALWKLKKAPSDSWDYLDVGARDASASPRPDAADGVVDKKTGSAIADAISKNLRRPGDILVEVEATAITKEPFTRAQVGKCWLRSDAAEAFYAWNELVLALGAKWGISFGHSFRSVFDAMNAGGPSPGKATKSHHKTGLALDLVTRGNFVPGAEHFPVVMTREPGDTWRLYLPSTYAIPAEEGAAAAATAAIGGKVRAALAKVAGNRRLGGYPEASEKILAALQSPAGFFDKYFKAEVTPWVYEPSLQGGYAEPSRGPGARGVSWLDITAVAAAAGLAPIGANNGWRGEEKKNVAPVPDLLKLGDLAKKPGSSILWQARVNEQETANDLAARRSAANALGVADTPESRTLTIHRGEVSSGVGVSELPLASAELEVMWNWVTSLVKLAKSPVAGMTFANPWLTISLPARPDPPVVEKVKTLLTDPKLGDKLFWGSHDDTPEVLTGSAWADKIVEIHKGLILPSEQTDGSIGTAEPKVSSYTILLTPVFSGTAEEPTTLGPGDTVTVWVDYRRCQEWWHFETDDASEALWFTNLERIGWRTECLRCAPVAALYGRTGVGYGPSKAEKKAADEAEKARKKAEADAAAAKKKAEKEAAAAKKKAEEEAAAAKKKAEQAAKKQAEEAAKLAKKG